MGLPISLNEYKDRLKDFLYEKKDQPEISQKAMDLASQASQKWVQTQDLEFKKIVDDALLKIAAVRPGRKLLKGLIKDRPTFQISPTKDHSRFVREGNRIEILNDPNQLITCIVHHDTKNKLKVRSYSNSELFPITLVHELIHASHPKVLAEPKELINPQFHTPEELVTISGFVFRDHSFKLLQKPICENIFRLAWGFELRANHSGCANEDGIINLNDWITLYNSIKLSDKKLIKNPFNLDKKIDNLIDIINIPLPCNCVHTKENLLPLSTAIKNKEKKLVEKLINKGSSLSLLDDMGGPLGAATTIYKKDPDYFTDLLDLALKSQDPLAFYPSLLHICERGDISPLLESLSPLIVKMIDAEKNNPACSLLSQALALKWHASHLAPALIKADADCNRPDASGNTPLMAILQSVKKHSLHLEIQKIFIQLLNHPEVDIHHTNKQGESALLLAIQLEDAPTLRILLQRGADVPPDLKERVEKILESQSPHNSPLDAQIDTTTLHIDDLF